MSFFAASLAEQIQVASADNIFMLSKDFSTVRTLNFAFHIAKLCI